MVGIPLYLFAKAPVAGEVKRRLCPPLSPAQSACVAAAMLKYAAAVVERGWLGERVMNAAPDLSHPVFEPYQNGFKWRTRVQPDTDLGERMREVLVEGIEAQGAAVVLGTDIPMLNFMILRETFRALQAGEQVIGPAEDGGFYLLGLREMPNTLFKGIEWGGPDVYAGVMRNARESGIRLTALPRLRDADNFEDLKLAAETVPEFRKALHASGVDLGLLDEF